VSGWALAGVAWAACAVVMAILWLVQKVRGDAGIVDVAWTAGVGALAILFSATADGYGPRRMLVAALAGLWAIRLAGYLFVRVSKLPEDGRYAELRMRWGDRTQLYLFLFFQIQAAWSVLFALPMWIAASNPKPALGFADALGLLIWIVAMTGESLADRTLARFRSDPANRGNVCDQGLWRYSRHPNYFFEWLHWWAYVAIGATGPHGWIGLAGPAVMLFFLLKVTGIPPTEAQALRSRGDAYREYQRVTSVFFPWPPKKAGAS